MKEVIKRVSKELKISRNEAELVVATLIDRPRFEIYTNRELDTETKTLLWLKMIQLKNGVPIEYITKRVQFLDHTLKIYPGIFIPRAETEYFIELIAKLKYSTPKSILEVGTGCGAIAIALAHVYSDAQIVATDISQCAIMNAQENIKMFDLEGRIELLQCNLFEENLGKFDLIVSNPPYIPNHRLMFLPKEVRDFEPIQALNGGRGGIQFIKRLIIHGLKYLSNHGIIALEFDHDEVNFLNKFIERETYMSFSFKKDLFNKFRYLFIGDFND